MIPISSSFRLFIWIIAGISTLAVTLLTLVLESNIKYFVRRILTGMNRGRPPTPQKTIIWVFYVVSIIGALLSAAVASSAPVKAEPTNVPEITNTLESANSPLLSAKTTPTFTLTTLISPSPTPTPTATPATIQDLPLCDFDERNYPCKFLVEFGNNQRDIAQLAYGNKQQVSRIVELYRDVKGKIPTFGKYPWIIIPDHNLVQDESYYAFYFRLLEYPIAKCEGEIFSFPCWYVSQGEPYSSLVEFYPSRISSGCISLANETEWTKEFDRLVTKPPVLGAIIVLPVCT